MATTKTRKLPTMRRQYHPIVGLDSGLDYSTPSTMIAETYCPFCEEVTFRDKMVTKAYGTEFFAGTNTVPLSGAVMMAKQFVKNNESEKFIVHTTTNVYVYNTTSSMLECITRGTVVENCEDVWTVPANVTTILNVALTGVIASIADYSGTVAGTVLVTDVDHGLSTGHTVYITGTTTYDGTYTITWVDADTFYITHAWGATSTGVWTTGYPYRKGSGSVRLMIETAFATGVAAYENFGAQDLSTYTSLHFYIRSDTATLATDLDIRISEENAGGTGGSYEDVSIPALVAGVWKEVSVAFAEAAGTRNAVLSVSLIVAANQPAIVVDIDDVMATIEMTGDEDDNVVAATINDYYVFSNGTANVLTYWDMATDTFTTLLGGTSLGCKAMQLIGERLCLYGITGASFPRRVQWTVVGGLTVTPVATDWTNAGSGDTDLDSIFGEDVIMTAHKLGNYVVVYGKNTIVMQEYTGKSPEDPFAFYVRVAGTGTPAERGVANLGDSHIVLGWDDVYLYKGGTDVQSIGDKVSRELFDLINPTYINRSFMIYLAEQYEVRLYFPLIGSSVPNCYFTYSLKNGSWSRGSRSYTGFGSYKRVTGADTWDSIGTPTTTWDEIAIRWNDVSQEELSPLNIYGDANGIVYIDNDTVLNNAGVAIDGIWDTKDFVMGEGYRRQTTNWMSLGFEATGDTVQLSYSTDLGLNYSDPVSFTLTNEWKQYRYDININSPQVRFRFRNYTLSQTYSVREVELGYVGATDRGVA